MLRIRCWKHVTKRLMPTCSYVIQLSRYPSGEINYLSGIGKANGEWCDDIHVALIIEDFQEGQAIVKGLGNYFTYGSTITLVKLKTSEEILQKMTKFVDDIARM